MGFRKTNVDISYTHATLSSDVDKAHADNKRKLLEEDVGEEEITSPKESIESKERQGEKPRSCKAYKKPKQAI